MAKTLPGRPHDLTSYTGALLVALVTMYVQAGTEALPINRFGLGHLGLVLYSTHFLRRILECLFVHRYAGRRVPLGDALGEYVYYWGFGAWNAWALATQRDASITVASTVGLLLFVSGELGNTWAHLKLRALRPTGTTERGLPKGGLFEWVSCANYTYEIVSWLGFTLAMRTLPSAVFLLAIVPVLVGWAKKRHARYKELFDGKDGRPLYPARRRALVPFVFIVG